jgi:formate dehydrogenase major subunit
MNARIRADQMAPSVIEFGLDGRTVQAHSGETILQAAQRQGVEIPHLCFKEGLRPDGNCRACVVEISGERTLAPSCCRVATAGMQVRTSSERAFKSQKMVLEMLLSDVPDQGYKWNDDGMALNPAAAPGQHGELSFWAERLQVSVRPQLRALRREQPAADLSHPAMAVNLDACIQCTRCVRACREEQVNDVIGYSGRGSHSQIVFDLADPMAQSQDANRLAAGRQEGRFGLPILWRGLPAHLQREGSADRQCRGPRWPGQPCALVRQGSLWF